MSSEQDAIVHRAVEHLSCPTGGFIRIANKSDAETLLPFINKAYIENRSMLKPKYTANRFGTVEEMHNLMEQGIFLLLIASDNEQKMILDDGCPIIACVFIHHLNTKQRDDDKLSAKINTLTVHPSMVRRGVAGYMMQVVDAVAKAFHYTHVSLTVISLYKYLVDMYSKYGFEIIETKSLADIGVSPQQFPMPCHVIVMEKVLL